MATTRRSKSSPIATVLIAILVLAIGCWQAVGNARLKKECTETVTGRVIEITKQHGGRSGIKYRATVSYSTPNGTYTVRTPSGKTHYSQGENITVKYSPSDHSKAYTPDHTSHPVLFIVFGAILLVVGGFGIFRKYILRTGSYSEY